MWGRFNKEHWRNLLRWTSAPRWKDSNILGRGMGLDKLRQNSSLGLHAKLCIYIDNENKTLSFTEFINHITQARCDIVSGNISRIW